MPPAALPDDDLLYQALLTRDPSYEGRVWVGVRSTGIFCRLTCPARKPKRENCVFYPAISTALEAGFRPCKRCTPLTPEGDHIIAPLLAEMERTPERRWRESDLQEMGYDPSTVRRAFQRAFGTTFLAMARQRRLGVGFTTLSEGGSVTTAQLDAGWDSASGFRASMAGLLGRAPGQIARDAHLCADWIDTPMGPMIAVTDDSAVHLLEFSDRKALPRELAQLEARTGCAIGIGARAPVTPLRHALDRYFAGQSGAFDVPLALHGSPFSRAVWGALQRIPVGETRSYGALAQDMGRPQAVRAIARANGANQIALLIPCHRVIGADGSLTGYGGGLWRKQGLLDLERQIAGVD